jgi:hypothetical protein
MAPTEPKISNLGAAVITRDMTLTIPGTHKIFMKPVIATASHFFFLATQNTGLLTIYGVAKHNDKSPIQI